jgi:hypothetical protein
MADHIDTRDGWLEYDESKQTYEGNLANVLVLYDNRGRQVRRWTREESVPPLPTTPGTVIGIGDWRLVRLEPYETGLPGAWEMLPIPEAVQGSLSRAGAKAQCVYGDEWVQAEAQQYGGFETLSEPRVVTARAVVHFLGSRRAGTSWQEIRDNVAREFGVADV